MVAAASSQRGELAQSFSQLICNLTNQRADGRRHHRPKHATRLRPPRLPPGAHLLVEGDLLLQVKLHHSVVVVDTVAMEMVHLSWRRADSGELPSDIFLFITHTNINFILLWYHFIYFII